MGNLEQLKGRAIVERHLRAIGDSPNRAELVNTYAQEMTARDAAIRSGFANIFAVTGFHQTAGQREEATRAINLGRIAEKAGMVSLRLSTPVYHSSESPTFEKVDLRFYDGNHLINAEQYTANAPVRVTLNGEDYYDWSQRFSAAAGAHYDGYEGDFRQLEETMHMAESWQAQIWEALGDVSLNPAMARVLNQQT